MHSQNWKMGDTSKNSDQKEMSLVDPDQHEEQMLEEYKAPNVENWRPWVGDYSAAGDPAVIIEAIIALLAENQNYKLSLEEKTNADGTIEHYLCIKTDKDSPNRHDYTEYKRYLPDDIITQVSNIMELGLEDANATQDLIKDILDDFVKKSLSNREILRPLMTELKTACLDKIFTPSIIQDSNERYEIHLTTPLIQGEVIVFQSHPLIRDHDFVYIATTFVSSLNSVAEFQDKFVKFAHEFGFNMKDSDASLSIKLKKLMTNRYFFQLFSHDLQLSEIAKNIQHLNNDDIDFLIEKARGWSIKNLFAKVIYLNTVREIEGNAKSADDILKTKHSAFVNWIISLPQCRSSIEFQGLDLENKKRVLKGIENLDEEISLGANGVEVTSIKQTSPILRYLFFRGWLNEDKIKEIKKDFYRDQSYDFSQININPNTDPSVLNKIIIIAKALGNVGFSTKTDLLYLLLINARLRTDIIKHYTDTQSKQYLISSEEDVFKEITPNNPIIKWLISDYINAAADEISAYFGIGHAPDNASIDDQGDDWGNDAGDWGEEELPDEWDDDEQMHSGEELSSATSMSANIKKILVQHKKMESAFDGLTQLVQKLKEENKQHSAEAIKKMLTQAFDGYMQAAAKNLSALKSGTSSSAAASSQSISQQYKSK